MLINTLRHTQYHELCELLGGFRNDYWMDLQSGNGELRLRSPEPWLFIDGAPVGETYEYALVRRTHFDYDYHNYVLAQVSPMGRSDWDFVLFHNTGANEWVPEQVYSWGTYCPSNGEAGAMVDEIEELRHLASRPVVQ